MNIPKEVLTILKKAKIAQQKISKNDIVEILRALKSVSTTPSLIAQFVQLVNGSYDYDQQFSELSMRERQIFHFIGLGFSSRQIAEALDISESTVSTHRKNMIRKLKLSGVGRLQQMAYQWVYSQNSKDYTQ